MQPQPTSSAPLSASFASEHICFGAGVAIFHIARARVVLCFHTRDRYWFLPKGRRDVGEGAERGAEREGFEESGYRNRLIPIPMRHRQTFPRGHDFVDRTTAFVTEPVWTQMAVQGRSAEYILFWYIAETLPPNIEEETNKKEEEIAHAKGKDIVVYQTPSPFPANMTLKERIALETELGGYDPVWHEGTTVDDGEENFYVSELVPIEDAVTRLRSVQAEVVKRGWEGIQARMTIENARIVGGK